MGDQGEAADFDRLTADLQRQIILDHQWFPFRWAFRRFECELASEFLSLDLKGMLARHGLGSFVTYPFLRDYARLLGAEKLEVEARNE